MITMTQMYWLVTLDSIVIASAVCLALSLIASVAAIGVALDMDKHWWLPKLTVTLAVLSLLAVTFIPSTKQMAAIIIVPKLVNNEKTQMMGNRLCELAVEWMEELDSGRRRR